MTAHSEASLRALLRAMHPKDTHFFAAAVRNSTGYAARTVRTADAIAMSLWPSRGLSLTGFEIKCARNDWLRELKDPAKAEDIASRCDFWTVVAPEGVVKLDEVPANWGWLAPGELPRKKGVGLIEMKAPVKLTPIAMDRPFLAGVLRAAQEDSPAEKELEAAKRRIEEDCWKRYQEKLINAQKAYDTQNESKLRDLQSTVSEFERVSGVSIRSYDMGHIGAAVRVIKDHGKDHTVRYLRSQANGMRQAADEMLKAAALLEKPRADTQSNIQTEDDA